jgi:hypothetical protein
MATVLYVGEDLCHRIRVMECGGLTVLHSDRSVLAATSVLSKNPGIDAIAFEHDTEPLPRGIAPAVRQHSASPLVLFENPNIDLCYGADHDEHSFDLVIPALTPAGFWLEALRAVIADSRRPQQECKEPCSKSQALQEPTEAMRRPLRLIDVNALWRGNPLEGEKPLPPEVLNKKR